MKKQINVFEYTNEIMQALEKGILVTSKTDDIVNTMTISWGSIGIEWRLPIFTLYIREGRYTRELLDKNPEFTINVPLRDFNKNILGYCGSKSGRNIDKIKELNLTLEESNNISVPGIKEFPLTLECRVIYQQLQDKHALSQCLQQFYPQDVASSHPSDNKDYHIAYYGQIVDAYIIED